MVLPIITKEQNFVLELFALKSIEKANSAMELNKPQPNKDPKLVRRIQEMMDELFRNIPEEFMSLLDVGVKHDQSVSLGMLSRLEEYTLTEESSFWINNLTNIIQKRLVSVFTKFIVCFYLFRMSSKKSLKIQK